MSEAERSIETDVFSSEESFASDQIPIFSPSISLPQLDQIRELCYRPGGLGNPADPLDLKLRQHCWRLMLGQRDAKLAVSEIERVAPASLDKKTISQIEMDLNRCQLILQSQPHLRDHALQLLKQRVQSVITQVLQRHPQLHYYQGYHDVVAVVVLLFSFDDDDDDDDDGKVPSQVLIDMVDRLTMFCFRDFMMVDMTACEPYLDLVNDLIQLEDEELFEYLQSVSDRPQWFRFWSVSWILTWMSHVVKLKFSHLLRLWDFFLTQVFVPDAGDQTVCVEAICYFAASLVLCRREEFLKVADPDEATILSMLQKYDIQEDSELESAIQRTYNLIEKYRGNPQYRHLYKKFCKSSCVKSVNLPDYFNDTSMADQQSVEQQQDMKIQQIQKSQSKDGQIESSGDKTVQLHFVVSVSLAVLLYIFSNSSMFPLKQKQYNNSYKQFIRNFIYIITKYLVANAIIY
ncbi:hypothetical protein MP228_001811 [Amoeboaphelidium protococcarum]|nr:hypothetical protein MP228_001811 [Amoeboaphelidium protococcarum]